MEPVGVIALFIFFAAIFGSIKGWIPQRLLPLQTTLLLASALISLIGMLFGKTVNLSDVVTVTSLHPITATIAGFMLAGAMKSAGAFDAASDMIIKIMRSRLGFPFAVILLINIPTIFAMPCGRVWVSPLIPVAMTLGYALSKEKNNPVFSTMVVFGLIVNAAASCGPSLIGGIGVLGEGMGRFSPGSFSNHQQAAIMFITTMTMILVRYIYKYIPSKGLDVVEANTRKIPEYGYLTFIFFIAGLAVTVILKPAIPLQAILLVMTLFIMIVARLSIKDLIEGIMIHPLTAMVSGFILAGVLTVYGGFDVLLQFLEIVANNTPLGYTGVAILTVYFPLFFPMPCGRIIAVSLIPGVLMFGERLNQISGNSMAQPAILVAFILAGAASCAPSPLGGIGSIGEGHLRLKRFVSGRFQSLAIFFGVPVSALSVSLFGLSDLNFSLNISVFCIASGIVSGFVINRLCDYKIFHPGGILGGLLTGILMVVF